MDGTQKCGHVSKHQHIKNPPLTWMQTFRSMVDPVSALVSFHKAVYLKHELT